MAIRDRFESDPLYLMDGSAFIYRGFYARQDMRRSDGFPTGALHIVARLLLKILREEQPRWFAFVLDGENSSTFRQEIFPMYKAQRNGMPEGLAAQLDPIRRLVKAFGLKLIVSEGCEADDCMASLAAKIAGSQNTKLENQNNQEVDHKENEADYKENQADFKEFAKNQTNRPVVLITGDKDLKQCVRPNVLIWDPASREEKIITYDSFTQETGLLPKQWADYQALVGDTSDNIPGILGIGPKTALKLLQEFPHLETIRDQFSHLPLTLRKKFEGNLDAIFLYRQLAQMRTDQCADLQLDDLRIQPMDRREVAAVLREFELRSLEKELVGLIQSGKVRATGDVNQPSLLEEITTQPRLICENIKTLVAIEIRKPSKKVYIDERTDHPHRIDLRDKMVAVVDDSVQTIFAIAPVDADTPFETHEYTYLGKPSDLPLALQTAAMVIAPDVKTLLHQRAEWKKIDPHKWFDIGLATYLLDPEKKDYSWSGIAAQWSEQLDISRENPALLALEITRYLCKQLGDADLLDLMLNFELPLIPVLATMEEKGILVDKDSLAEFLREVQTDLDHLTEKIFQEAGGEFNIRSAQQIGEVLFQRLKLPAERKTPSGQASTSQDVLEKLSGTHPVVDALLEFRRLEKLRSTYLEPLPKFIDKHNRIHTTFNQTGTATGRLSSSNPNLQNIPARGDQGRRMRACFTAPPGSLLVSADYSQIELRILARLSEDATMMMALISGEDLHAKTAGLLFDIPIHGVTPDQRRIAKTINFGLIYGMGSSKLARELHISTAEAREFMQRYFERMPGIRRFCEKVENQAVEQGYVVTLAGRKRYFPDLHSENPQLLAAAKRQAFNTLIQGSAADVIKLAMISVYNDKELRNWQAKLILQIHDELVLEVPEATAKRAENKLTTLMVVAGIQLHLSLVAKGSIDSTWS